jgi:hypothetical protein
LNIVHAGLDLLQLTIKAADPTSPFVSIDRSTADFVFQMFFASESAINILNDLLQYEHIESGDYLWLPLWRPFGVSVTVQAPLPSL